jgi:hypothetical protein
VQRLYYMLSNMLYAISSIYIYTICAILSAGQWIEINHNIKEQC